MRARAGPQPSNAAMQVPASPVERSIQAKATASPSAKATVRLLARSGGRTAASTDVPGVRRRSGRSPPSSLACSDTATLCPAARRRAVVASSVEAGTPHIGMSAASFWRRLVR
jgi:hypothetical protein